MILGLAVGCGAFGLTDPGGEIPGRLDEVLAIEGVDPSWGRPGEETEVTITGTGLADVTTVKFGNAEVDFALVDDTLVATAPVSDFEATVDVLVSGETGTATLDDGFTYAEEEPEGDTDTDSDSDTDTDTDTDTDADNSDKTGGLVQFSLLQIACPECIGMTTSLDVSAQAGFHAPTRAGWLDWLPSEGSCETNATSTPPASTFFDAGEWAYLSAGSVSIGMRSDSDGVYSADGLDETDFVRNSGYDLSLPEGGSDLDAFSVTDALTTPQAISALSPEDILYTSPRDAFAARISRGGADFTWSPSGGDGTFLVVLSVYSASTGDPLGEVTCRGADNGRMTVPASAIGAYPTGSLLLVGMYRYTIGSFERPDDHSRVDTVASFGVLGTGSLAP